jgi:type VI secretion system secreted protein Hcp
VATLRIGHILGESVTPGYEAEIDVRTWSWGVAHPEDLDQQPAILDLVMTKGVDKASPELVMLACSGRVVPEAVLTVPRGGRWTDLVMLRIRLSDVRVRSAAFTTTFTSWRIADEQAVAPETPEELW